jgi:hypothetical protein
MAGALIVQAVQANICVIGGALMSYCFIPNPIHVFCSIFTCSRFAGVFGREWSIVLQAPLAEHGQSFLESEPRTC